MQVVETALPGVLLVKPRVFGDARGFFLESFNEARFADAGLPTRWRQDNHSRSVRGTLRGLHYQLRQPQGKLVTCVRGTVWDVAVDIRVGSPHFGRWTGVTLDGDDPAYLWIPPGFAHGFCVLSDVADFTYKCTDLYAADDDRGVLWNDPDVGVEWPLDAPLLSGKDTRYRTLRDPARDDLPRYAAP